MNKSNKPERCPKCGSPSREEGYMPCTFGIIDPWHTPPPATAQSAEPVPEQWINELLEKYKLSTPNGLRTERSAKINAEFRINVRALIHEIAVFLHSNPNLTTLREIYAGMSEFIEAAETMIEFLPVYSESSAGYQRKERLKQAIQKLRGVLA